MILAPRKAWLFCLVAVAACGEPEPTSSPSKSNTAAADKPAILKGTYEGSGGAEFAFDNASHEYSITSKADAFEEHGTFTFEKSELTLKSSTGDTTVVDVKVNATTDSGTKAQSDPYALTPQGSVVIGASELLPGATNITASACNGGVTLTFERGGKTCSIFLSNATLKLK
jgi:hypothetical protein